MSKLYFGSTNAGYITIAIDEESGLACYLHEDGTEGELYPSHFDLDELSESDRNHICTKWLHEIANYNCFDQLYAECDVESGYCGVCSAEEALKNIDEIGIEATLEF